MYMHIHSEQYVQFMLFLQLDTEFPQTLYFIISLHFFFKHETFEKQNNQQNKLRKTLLNYI